MIIATTISLLSFFHHSHAQEGLKVDTINLAEIPLEERHLGYIYDFALNSALHQYVSIPQSRLMRSFSQLTLSSNSAFIVSDVLPMDFKDLEKFIYPDTFSVFQLIEGSHQIIFTDPFVSQYDLELLAEFGMDTLSFLPILEDVPDGSDDAEMAIVFSNLYQHQNSFFILVGIAHHRSRTVESISSSGHIIEFEWCESMSLVYPRRVTSPTFHRNYGEMVLEIPSLWCPPPE